MTPAESPPLLSVIVPVYNGGAAFADCLAALGRSEFQQYELIVIDDGSTDGSADLAAQAGALVGRTGGRCGPAAARNLGAAMAQGRHLCFIDADCAVHPTALGAFVAGFQAEPELVAIFGSYDTTPAAAGFVAQYKNLAHHYVHQQANREAATFWAGCGAVRRQSFLAVGGFDAQRYPRATIEDIELGHRLRQAGGRIRLAPQIQVSHHKAWTLTSMIRSDIFDRALPWTALMVSESGMQADLNVRLHHRLSALAVYGLLTSLLLRLRIPGLPRLDALCAAFLLIANQDLYRFFWRVRGPAFALRAVPLHWLYYAYSLLAFGLGVMRASIAQRRAKAGLRLGAYE